MTAARAKKIIEIGNKIGDYDKYITAREARLISDIWETLDDASCWLDALEYIANGHHFVAYKEF